MSIAMKEADCEQTYQAIEQKQKELKDLDEEMKRLDKIARPCKDYQGGSKDL